VTPPARATLVVANDVPDVPRRVVVELIERTAAAWGVVIEVRTDGARPRIAEDGHNVLLFTDLVTGARGTGDPDALTTLYSATPVNALATGTEFDIVIRKSGDWSGADGRARLEALLAHEMGHVLGKPHSCELELAGAAVAGKPECHDADDLVLRSVMYPDALEPGRVLALTPTAWDLDPQRSADTATIGWIWSVGVCLALAAAVALRKIVGLRRIIGGRD
jgi:hypothetical protein